MIPLSGVRENMVEFSYHRYRGATIKNIVAIADRGEKFRLRTSMLEHSGSGYSDLHEDLKVGRVSAWQQYTLAYPDTRDSGASYYRVESKDPVRPRIYRASRTIFLQQYFRHIRSGAQRIGAVSNTKKLDPLAFLNRDRKYVVVIKANQGADFTVRGLLPGAYVSKYVTKREAKASAKLHNIGAGQTLSMKIPDAGVVSIYDSSSRLLIRK
jgi:hypothetical protein